jgi:hypothetical protein
MTGIGDLPKLFNVYRSGKRCLDILDELFGRDQRASDQITLDQLTVAPITTIVIAISCPLFGALPVSF